jgi:hypothetical protein
MLLKDVIASRTTMGNIPPLDDTIEDAWQNCLAIWNETLFMGKL